LTVELRVDVDVDASPGQVFAALTDWSHQGEWMPGTQVRVTKGSGDGVGDEIVARTALPGAWLKWMGFDDPMRITHWEPEVRCDVVHLGRVVRGTGAFIVEPRGAASRFSWIERVDPPFGRFGQLGLRLLRRPAEFALGVALKRFARWVERASS
jgi:carbon monoxide dehydrogenase subunit G